MTPPPSSPSSMFPLGAAVTEDELGADLHAVFARLRRREPISWLPALDAWVVTSRDLALQTMRDAATFTVEDPRFSTAQVLGPSMLSLDGSEHDRHRNPFAGALRLPEVRRRFAGEVQLAADQMLRQLRADGHAELRRQLAGPLAVRVVTLALELVDADPDTLLSWYDEIVAAVTSLSNGHDRGRADAAVGLLARSVQTTMAANRGVVGAATATLSVGEVVSNTAVMLFGGIETSEGMTTNAFAHLLGDAAAWSAVAGDPRLVANAVEESLRLEPAVVRVDRFATRDVQIGGASVARGDLVIVALAAANRDPAVFADPDRFDPARPNAMQHVTFAQGPHICPGMHLARLETHAAITAAITALPRLRLDPAAAPPRPEGTVFRKPHRLDVVWDAR